VRKHYGLLEVLKGVSFDVAPGEVVAIIGASGSGKSTDLRCIKGLGSIQSGGTDVCGHQAGTHRKEAGFRALRQDVGIVFQSYNLFPHLTVKQNVTLALRRMKRMGNARARELSRACLAQVGLAEKAEAYPEQLSGGQQQRVATALARHAAQGHAVRRGHLRARPAPDRRGVARDGEAGARRHDHDHGDA
jgi:polar amino acid transport system ATP-binding protein